MTPEKQRIKIAEAHGWVLNPECDFLGKAFPQCWTHDDYNMVFHDYELPDYLNDLNAMHEAETVLPKDLRACWMIELCKITDDSFWATTRATAAQRAEAFLKTLNLWTP